MGLQKRLLEGWRALGGSLSRLGGLESLRDVMSGLTMSWEVLGRLWRHITGVLELPGSSWSRLGALEAMLKSSRGQNIPKIEPERLPNRAPEATRAENGKTTKLAHRTQDFNDLSGLRASSSC